MQSRGSDGNRLVASAWPACARPVAGHCPADQGFHWPSGTRRLRELALRLAIVVTRGESQALACNISASLIIGAPNASRMSVKGLGLPIR